MTQTVLYAGTPTIGIRDNLGLTVRTLRYNRRAPGEVATQLVGRRAFNALGQPASSQDARFFAQGGSSSTLNFQYMAALSGQVLLTLSTDAGVTRAFHDIAGHPVWQRDARDTIQQFAYDALGRPLTRAETLEGKGDPAVRERWVYGDATPPAVPYDATGKTDPRNLNQRGRAIQHYDTAGLLDAREAGYTVQGAPRRQDRSLLPAETPSDWTDTAVANWRAALTAGTAPIYSTSWAYNALARALDQTDARGHRQRNAYDIAGRKSACWVTPAGQLEKPVTTSITYAAGGQIATKADANGVTTDYAYEPQTTQRVLALTVTRKPSRGAAAVLQDLSYTYDPVGNVIGLDDGAQATAYFKNRAVSAARTYTYDALYQLISASGRENVAGTPSGTDSPQAFTPLNTANYRPYTRRYAYDLGGNLTQIAPGNSLPARTMTVAAASNRAVSNANTQGVTAATVANYFDAAGNANCLDGNPNQPMRWSGLNQLGCLVTIQRSARDQTQNDRESYAYGGDGQRVRKTGFAKTANAWSQADTIYLPGLEIRSQSTGELLEVIVLDDGARVLNWGTTPADGIENQQLRYQYRERQGSCQIETDDQGAVISQEEYYPYGGSAVWASRSTSEAKYKTVRYSGQERDAAGLYYYGFRYYQPWIGRWISPDPAGTVDGQNLYCMVKNNPVTLIDALGLNSDSENEVEKAASKPGATRNIGRAEPASPGAAAPSSSMTAGSTVIESGTVLSTRELTSALDNTLGILKPGLFRRLPKVAQGALGRLTPLAGKREITRQDLCTLIDATDTLRHLPAQKKNRLTPAQHASVENLENAIDRFVGPASAMRDSLHSLSRDLEANQPDLESAWQAYLNRRSGMLQPGTEKLSKEAAENYTKIQQRFKMDEGQVHTIRADDGWMGDTEKAIAKLIGNQYHLYQDAIRTQDEQPGTKKILIEWAEIVESLVKVKSWEVKRGERYATVFPGGIKDPGELVEGREYIEPGVLYVGGERAADRGHRMHIQLAKGIPVDARPLYGHRSDDQEKMQWLTLPGAKFQFAGTQADPSRKSLIYVFRQVVRKG